MIGKEVQEWAEGEPGSARDFGKPNSGVNFTPAQPLPGALVPHIVKLNNGLIWERKPIDNWEWEFWGYFPMIEKTRGYFYIYIWLHWVLASSSLTEQAGPPALGARNLNHWATRKVLRGCFLKCKFMNRDALHSIFRCHCIHNGNSSFGPSAPPPSLECTTH